MGSLALSYYIKGESSMVVLGKILIMDLELRAEALKKAARELEALRMVSVKQELVADYELGGNIDCSGELLEASYSAGYMPATNKPKEDWL